MALVGNACIFYTDPTDHAKCYSQLLCFLPLVLSQSLRKKRCNTATVIGCQVD